MAKYSFADDPVSHTAVRYILIFELAVLVPVVGLAFTPYALMGLCIAFVAMLFFWGVFVWLYRRYQGYPVVKEKSTLTQQANTLQNKIRAEVAKIQLAPRIREKLKQAQQDETAAALRAIQEAYIKNGLAQARITDAQIAGVGPKLKERLALHGIANAANISPTSLQSVDGFGEVKKQAVLTWRNAVHSQLNQSKPAALPAEQANAIKNKFDTKHAANDASEQEAGQRKLALDNELTARKPRLHELEPVTFGNYLWHIFSKQKAVAAIMAVTLVASQVCLLSSASMGVLAVSVPTVTPTPTVDINALQTATAQTMYNQATETALAMPSSTPSATATFTETLTPVLPTASNTIVPSDIPRPTNTPVPPIIVPAGNANCDPSYPGVCIPPRPPDLDCKDVGYKRFKVLPPDPHGFDGDNDGIGCES